MHLDEIDLSPVEPSERLLDLGDACFPTPGPHLGGDEKRIGQARFPRDLANQAFRIPIRGRRIDHFSPVFGKARNDFGDVFCFWRAGRNVECYRAPKSNYRKLLAG